MAMSKCNRDVAVQVEASAGSYSRDERDRGEHCFFFSCVI
jgi:hypothetical protein